MVVPDKVIGPGGKKFFDKNVKGVVGQMRLGGILRTVGGIALLIIAFIQLHELIVGVIALVGGLLLLGTTHLRK